MKHLMLAKNWSDEELNASSPRSIASLHRLAPSPRFIASGTQLWT
jgi:hypothetical protein